MKFVAPLLLLFLATVAAKQCPKKCSVTRGWRVETFAGNFLNMQIPCKYKLVDSRCGDFDVRISPSNTFVYPTYNIENLWISVKNRDTNVTWSGRTSQKMTAKYMTERKNTAFANKPDCFSILTDVFTETKTKSSVILSEKSGAFRITYTPFNMNGDRNRDNELHFECFEELESVNYPNQFCGGADRSVVNQRAKDMFGSIHNKDMLLVLDVFNNSDVAEQNDKCIMAGELMTYTCKTPEKQIKAAEICGRILTSRNHTKCVLKYSCDVMDVFNDCLDFVCNDYPGGTGSCARLGKATDLCRANFSGLTDRVKEAGCFIDYFTGTDIPHSSKEQAPKE